MAVGTVFARGPDRAAQPTWLGHCISGSPEDFGVAKFSSAGKLLAATYLGGNGHEINGPDEIAVDAQGNVIIAGSTSSTDYPTTAGTFQSKNAGAGGKFPVGWGNGDCWVAKFKP